MNLRRQELLKNSENTVLASKERRNSATEKKKFVNDLKQPFRRQSGNDNETKRK
jgi:hypothetical protein